MKKLCGEHLGSVAALAQCKAAVRERKGRTRRGPRGGDLEDPLLIAPRRAKWPLAIQLESCDFTAHLCTGIGTQSYKLLVIPRFKTNRF